MFDSLELPPVLQQLLEIDTVVTLLQLVGIAILGFLVVNIVTFAVTRTIMRRMSEQSVMVVRKFILYSGLTVIVMIVLAQLGLDLGALLGAAGVAGIAIGIAAQASLSNVVAGMFLISENSFSIGDIIRINDHIGTVLTVDLLSVKIRTFDNTYVRVPNDSLIKTEVTNITRFPIRRLDVSFSVDIEAPVEKVRNTLLSIAEDNPLILDEPDALFMVKHFGPRGVEILFGVWLSRTDYLAVRNGLLSEIQRRFKSEHIAIPQSILVPGAQ